MRILITSSPGRGRLDPLVALARALGEEDHRIAVASPPTSANAVAKAGVTHLAVGPEWSALPSMAATTLDAFLEGPMLAWSRAALPDLIQAADHWHPDLVVAAVGESSGVAVAHARGIPVASFAYAGLVCALPAVQREVNELVGVPAGAAPGMELVFAPRGFGGSLQVPGRRYFRPLPWPELPRSGIRDSVGDVWLAAGCSARAHPPWSAAVARALEGGRAPILETDANARAFLRRLAQCRAVVTAGGYRSVVTALAFGIPLVVTPIDPLGERMARAVEAIGVGKFVPLADGARAIRAAVDDVIGDAGYRDRALLSLLALRGMGPPADAVRALVQFAESESRGVPG